MNKMQQNKKKKVDPQQDFEWAWKQRMNRFFVDHINKRCDGDCPFCKDFNGNINYIDEGYLEDYLAGNY